MNYLLADLTFIDFDPDILNAGVSFLAVAGKYAFFFGILGFLVKMLVKAGTGKERFL